MGASHPELLNLGSPDSILLTCVQSLIWTRLDQRALNTAASSKMSIVLEQHASSPPSLLFCWQVWIRKNPVSVGCLVCSLEAGSGYAAQAGLELSTLGLPSTGITVCTTMTNFRSEF